MIPRTAAASPSAGRPAGKPPSRGGADILRKRQQAAPKAPGISILEAIADQNLFAPWFADASWSAWFVFLRALFGLPMDDVDAVVYRKCTGREDPPSEPNDEAWLIVGRRGGKSFMLALVGVFLACFKEYRQHLQPGERATIAIVAADRKQARIILRYVRGMLNGIPMLGRMIERETAEGFDLNNAATIEVSSASFRSTRGYSFGAVLGDEIAFWRTDEGSANPDTEILTALRPGLATIPGAMLICASSPYTRKGELWQNYRRYFGKAGGPLVWRATTRDMNPKINQRIVDEALERDHARASAEYNAQFRSDIESFVAREVVEAAIKPGCHELLPAGLDYYAFVDPSGGSADSMTLAIAHGDADGRAILDAVREARPPFSPEAVVSEFAALLKNYGIAQVTGDRYAGEWPRERFRVHDIEYNVAEKPKSDVYRDVLPLLNSGRVELLDNMRLANQLCALERRTARGGRDSIDHPPMDHDDLANSAAGAIIMAAAQPDSLEVWKKLV